MNAKPTIDELKAAADTAEHEAQEAMRDRKERIFAVWSRGTPYEKKSTEELTLFSAFPQGVC